MLAKASYSSDFKYDLNEIIVVQWQYGICLQKHWVKFYELI